MLLSRSSERPDISSYLLARVAVHFMHLKRCTKNWPTDRFRLMIVDKPASPQDRCVPIKLNSYHLRRNVLTRDCFLTKLIFYMYR